MEVNKGWSSFCVYHVKSRGFFLSYTNTGFVLQVNFKCFSKSSGKWSGAEEIRRWKETR